MLGGPAVGIQHLDLGIGDSSWDTLGVPAPTAGTTALVDSTPVVFQLTDLQLNYIDVVGAVVTEPQHRLQVVLTLEPGDLPITGDEVFPLREFALFGELNSNDYMIDYVRHPVMNIGAGDTLTRTIRLVF
jgi:hypothetical protein